MKKLAPPSPYDFIYAVKLYAAEHDCSFTVARQAMDDPVVRAEYELRARRERWELNFRYNLLYCPYCDTKLLAPRRPGAEVSYFCTGDGRCYCSELQWSTHCPDACPGCGAVWPLKNAE